MSVAPGRAPARPAPPPDPAAALRALLVRILVDEYLAELAPPPPPAHDSALRP